MKSAILNSTMTLDTTLMHLATAAVFCALTFSLTGQARALDAAQSGTVGSCGCNVADRAAYRQPAHCGLKSVDDLIGVQGYLKAVAKTASPWTVKELRQTGPAKWDEVPSNRLAKTPIRVIDARLDEGYDWTKARLQVADTTGKSDAKPYWIPLPNFSAVAWWQCPAHEAVKHAPIWVRPKADSKPLTLEGRWVTGPSPRKLWCWTYVASKGVYCDPRPDRQGFDPWIYQSDELEVEY